MIRNLARSGERPLLVIDMHAHLFNADDLPVRGFVKHADFGADQVRPFAGLLGRLARSTPTAADDVARLRGFLEVRGPIGAPAGRPGRVLRWVAKHASRTGRYGRFVHMGTMAMQSRLDILKGIEQLCADDAGNAQVQLFVSLGVDLEWGSLDEARTAPRDQFEVQAFLSEVTLRQRFEDVTAVTLPFAGFDPHRRSGDPRNSLAEVQRLVCSGEAVGVKLYPPLGFFPISNGENRNDQGVDDRLHALYRWCAEEGVPISAHCSPANDVEGYERAAHPENWVPVLHEHRGLRLNLSHVGGLPRGKKLVAGQELGWLEPAVRLITENPKWNVYADVGNHDLATSGPRYFEQLGEMIRKDVSGTLAGRLMFGTDYWFLLMHEDPERFLEDYAANMRRILESEERYRGFMGLNAREFLGFDDPWRQNRVRVSRRIHRLGIAVPEPLQRVFDGK